MQSFTLPTAIKKSLATHDCCGHLYLPLPLPLPSMCLGAFFREITSNSDDATAKYQ